jgi:ribonuclease R
MKNRKKPRRDPRKNHQNSRQTERSGRKQRPAPRAPLPQGPLIATVDKNHKGFGFLVFHNQKNREDLFLPPGEASRFFHGDRVSVKVGPGGRVLGVTLIERRVREIVGRFQPNYGGPPRPTRPGVVQFERKKTREEIFIPNASLKVQAGDWVQVQLDTDSRSAARYGFSGKIVQHFGPELPATADVGMIAAEFSLTDAHSPESIKEAEGFTLDLSEVSSGIRKDLRSTPFITIDGETARDFDDAVFVERIKSGYRLWVAIADVSHYVTPGSALDKEAYSRGTSVYFPERAYHMLPRALSENLCSLKPHEDRLAFVSVIDFDRSGRKLKTELMEAVINSKRRATYNEIQEEFGKSGKNKEWEYKPHFELYALIRKTRSGRGSIDFDLPEASIVCDEKMEPVEIVNRERLDSHRLIEEFMIAANEAVTEWALERNWPFIYRTHDEPSEEALERFETLAHNAGIRLKLDAESDNLNFLLADVVKRLEGHPAQTLLNTMLLRSMKQAIYSAEHRGHFGLASEAYTHFTSPIRRYPDLVVHRLLRFALRSQLKKGPRPTPREIQTTAESLENVASHCSYRERLAAEADREAIRLKQARYMLRHLGEEFDGKVNGLIENGIFVELPTPFVEGFVHRDTLADDFYIFNEERMTLTGRRTRRTFRIGDPIRIRVAKADIEKRMIDFAWVDTSTVDRSKKAREPKRE